MLKEEIQEYFEPNALYKKVKEGASATQDFQVSISQHQLQKNCTFQFP